MDTKYKKIVSSLCCAMAPAAFNNNLIKNCCVKAARNELSQSAINYFKSEVGEGILFETIIELETCRIKYAKDKNSIKNFKFTHLKGDAKEILKGYEVLERANRSKIEAAEILLNPMSQANVVKTGYEWLVKGIATLIPGILVTVAGIKTIGILMETLREKKMDKIREERRKKAQEAYDKINKVLYSNSSIDYSQDWKTVEKKFNLLKKKSPHNAGPIDSIVKELRGYFSSCKKNPKAKCKLISIYGPPGCGKSSCCEDMAKALGASNPVKITYADFDPGNKKLSVRQQVSGKWHVGDQERGYLAYGKLVSAIIHNKHLILILDEIDKLPKEVIPLVISLLWDAADSGRINIDGKDVILEGAVIILPTNQPIYNIKLNDDSDGKNMIIKALISRMRIYEFNKPREQDYKVAIKNLLESITKDVKEDYELELKCDDNIIDWLSKKFVKNDIGMRSIRVYDSLIRGAIQEKYDKECEATGLPSIQNIKLALDDEENLVCVSYDISDSDKKPDKLKSVSKPYLKKYDNKNDEDDIKKMSKMANEIFDDIDLTNIPDSIDFESVLDESDLKFLKSLILMIDPKVQIFNVNEQLNFVLKNKEKIKEKMINDGITGEQVKNAKSLKFKINSILNRDSDENVDDVKDVNAPPRIKIEDNREGIKA